MLGTINIKLEILLHRFQREVINRAKNSTKASWGSHLLYVMCKCFYGISHFWENV